MDRSHPRTTDELAELASFLSDRGDTTGWTDSDWIALIGSPHRWASEWADLHAEPEFDRELVRA